MGHPGLVQKLWLILAGLRDDAEDVGGQRGVEGYVVAGAAPLVLCAGEEVFDVEDGGLFVRAPGEAEFVECEIYEGVLLVGAVEVDDSEDGVDCVWCGFRVSFHDLRIFRRVEVQAVVGLQREVFVADAVERRNERRDGFG